MIWEGKELVTFGDIGDAAVKIAKSQDREKAKKFLQAHADALAEKGKLTPGQDPFEVAASNIGYWAGYMDRETMELMWEIFDVDHPMFGRKVPTAIEAFEMGVERGLSSSE